jgi:serine/threonine protein kinase
LTALTRTLCCICHRVLAPEQVREKARDYLSDTFALGTILYEMLTGRREDPDLEFHHKIRIVSQHRPAYL